MEIVEKEIKIKNDILARINNTYTEWQLKFRVKPKFLILNATDYISLMRYLDPHMSSFLTPSRQEESLCMGMKLVTKLSGPIEFGIAEEDAPYFAMGKIN